MRSARILLLLIAVSIVMGACQPQSSSETTIPSLRPPGLSEPDTGGPTGSTEGTVKTLHEYRGALPDGTDYVISINQDRAEEVTLDYAPIVYEPTGELLTARMAELPEGFDGVGAPTFTDGVFRVIAGSWIVEVVFDAALLETIGRDASGVVLSSIRVDLANGFPFLVVSPPFAWDPDRIPPEIRYETFVVRSGCGTAAVMCSDGRVVQVIPAQSLYPGSPGLFGDVVSVESESARPVANANFLDPGPLSARALPDVIWTGTEMIVWGGWGSNDEALIDGARFNPETNEWQLLPTLPVDAQHPTRATWIEGRLLVVGAEGTFAWEPGAESWEVVETGGPEAPEYPGLVSAIGTNVYLWGTHGISTLDLSADQPQWTNLPDSPVQGLYFPFHYRQTTALTVSGNDLYVTVRPWRCGEWFIVRWDGEAWHTLPTASLKTVDRPDCANAVQTAATPDGIVIWHTMDHMTLAYSAVTNSWSEIDRIPLPAAEDPSGPVPVGDAIFLVPRPDSGVVFDADNNSWISVVVPGSGSEATMVWTGTEFLSWATAPYGAAFRRAPEQITLVNSATTR